MPAAAHRPRTPSSWIALNAAHRRCIVATAPNGRARHDRYDSNLGHTIRADGAGRLLPPPSEERRQPKIFKTETRRGRHNLRPLRTAGHTGSRRKTPPPSLPGGIRHRTANRLNSHGYSGPSLNPTPTLRSRIHRDGHHCHHSLHQPFPGRWVHAKNCSQHCIRHPPGHRHPAARTRAVPCENRGMFVCT